jgi:alkaline phosphatase
MRHPILIVLKPLLALPFLCVVSAVSAAVSPVPLTGAANTGFSDDKPEDRQGGWTDQGGNDLRLIKPGKLTAAGVPFALLDETASEGKACIVLGGPTRSYLPTTATLPVPALRGNYLYLLHAAAWCPPAKAQKMTGVLFLDYEDGSSAELHVRFGRDVGDWTSPASFKNAARGWTAYNGNTQVSLFASRFPIKKPLPLKAVRFESRESTWMIAAASIGDEVALKAIKADLTLDKSYVAPPPLTAPLAPADESAKPQNVILIIGDGMGAGALQLTSLYQHKAEGKLTFQQFPVSSHCTTLNIATGVTDSAAAATALASGRKTDNGSLGLTPDNLRLTPFTELAHAGGRSVGLITSDALTGATPAGFYAHVDTRGAYQGVADDAASCGYEILIGNHNARPWFVPKAAGGQRTDTRNLLGEMAAAGYTVVEDLTSFAAAPAGARALGFMAKGTLDPEACLAQLTETALARLSKNDKGFFLMVECTITDGGGHGNNPELTVRGTLQVDWAARVAADFAQQRGDTLVLVTADHETGGLSSSVTNASSGKLVINYTTTSHTGAPVPLYAYGPGAHLFRGKVDNTDVAKNIARLWNLTWPPPAAGAEKQPKP